MKRPQPSWCTAAGMALLSLACAEPAPEDPVLVEIGETTITQSEFEAYVSTVVEEKAPFAKGQLEAQLLDELVEERLLLMAADEEGIRVEPEELDGLSQPPDFPPEAPALETRQAGPGRGLDHQEILSHLRVRKLIDQHVLKNVRVDENEIAAYYEEHRAYYKQPEAVDVSQILVETEEEARELLLKLKRKPSLFGELARLHSTGPEAAQDGHLGTFRKGELPPDFEKVVFSLRKGGLSDLVKTDFGFHIFRVNAVRRSRNLSLEEVADTVRVKLLRQKSDEAMVNYVEELKKRHPVKVHTERLDFPYLEHGG